MKTITSRLTDKNTLVLLIILAVFAVLSIRLLFFVNRHAVNFLTPDQLVAFTPMFVEIDDSGSILSYYSNILKIVPPEQTEDYQFLYDKLNNEINWLTLFFWQHGPHRQGVGLVLTSWIYRFSNWDTVIECYYIAILLIITTAAALLLKKRLFNRFSFFDIVIPILCLNLIQYETIIVMPYSSHSIFPLLLLCILGLSFTINNEWLKHISVSISTFLLLFTGYGLLIGFIMPIVLSWSIYCRTKKQKTLSVMQPLLSLLFFLGSIILFLNNYLLSVASGGSGSFLSVLNSPANIFNFIFLMFDSYFQLYEQKYILLGAIPALLTCVICVKSFYIMTKGEKNSHTVDILSFIFCSFTMLFCIGTAFGRMPGYPLSAQTSRYSSLLIPSLLIIYFQFYSQPKPFLRNALLTTLLVVSMSTCLFLNDHNINIINNNTDQKKCMVQSFRNNKNLKTTLCDCDLECFYNIFIWLCVDERNLVLKKHGLNLYKGQN